MFDDIKSLIKHTSIYSIGNIISKALNVLLVPVYTKYIPVNMFGIYSIIQVTKQFILGILPFGLRNALIRWISLENSQEKKDSILFSTTMTVLLIGLVIVLLTLVVKSSISQLISGSTKFENSIFIVSVVILLKLVNQIGMMHIRYKERSILFISISISKFLIQLLFTIYLVAFQKMGIIGIFIGQLSGEFASILYVFPYLINNSKFSIRFNEMKKMINYGFPLTFSSISDKILNMGDRYILGYLTNWSIVGVYSLGYKFANLIKTIFIGAFTTAFLPKAWKKLKQKNAKRFYSKLLTYFVFFIFWVSLFISIYSKGIIHIFARDQSYWDAALIVPIAVFAISIKGMFPVLKMGFEITKNTKYIAYIVTIAAGLNIILNFVLIPFFKMYGAVFATLLSFIFMVIIGYYYSHKFYPVKFEWNRIAKICIIISGIYFISTLFNPFSLILRIVFKLILLLSYPFILYFTDFYHEQELKRLKGAWKKWKNPKNWKKNLQDIDTK